MFPELFLLFTIGGSLVAGSPVASLDRAAELYSAGDVEGALATWAAVAQGDGSDSDRAAARNNRCVVLRLSGSVPQALEECRSAVAMRRESGEERGLGRSLNNLGLTLQELALYEEAERAFREAVSINQRRGDIESMALNLNNLAALSSLRGEHSRALAILEPLDEVLSAHAGEPWVGEQQVVAMLNRSVALEGLGAYREALDLARPWAQEGRLRDARRGPLLVTLGALYRNLGDPELAITYFEKGHRLLAASGDDIGAANALFNVGQTLHLNLGQLAKAESVLREAIRLFRAGGSRTEEFRGMLALGRLLVDRERFEEATATFDEAATLVGGPREASWPLLHARATLRRQRGELSGAIDLLRRAVAIVEEEGATLGDPQRWSGYLNERRGVFELLITCLMEEGGDGNHREALVMSWRAKGREILEASRTVNPQDVTPSPDALDRVLETLSPTGGVLGRGSSPLLIEYFVAEGALVRWSVHATGVEGRVVGPWQPIRRKLESLRRSFTHGGGSPSAALEDLSAIVLEGLEGRLTPGRVWIAPDRGLGSLPLDLLSDLEGGQLLDTNAVAQLPSGFFLSREAATGPAARLFIGFADPAPGADPMARPGLHLPALPGARRELELAALRMNRLETHRFVGAEATEERAEAELEHRPLILHLATHTVVDRRAAAVLLHPTEGSDGIWNTREILDKGRSPPLVVLSSCRSAIPETESGLTALSGAFLASGSSAVLATLWDVDDETTALVMDRFYALLAQGRSPAEALARVKRRFRDDPRWNDHPSWSSFVLLGDGRDLRISEAFRPPKGDLGLGSIVLVFLAVLAVALLKGARRRGSRSRSRR